MFLTTGRELIILRNSCLCDNYCCIRCENALGTIILFIILFIRTYLSVSMFIMNYYYHEYVRGFKRIHDISDRVIKLMATNILKTISRRCLKLWTSISNRIRTEIFLKFLKTWTKPNINFIEHQPKHSIQII